MLLRLSDEEMLNALSYGDQAHISIMTEIPLHSGFSPASIAAKQAMFQNAPRPQPVAPTNSGGRPSKSEPPTAGQSLIQR
jgi:hypothetical protein